MLTSVGTLTYRPAESVRTFRCEIADARQLDRTLAIAALGLPNPKQQHEFFIATLIKLAQFEQRIAYLRNYDTRHASDQICLANYMLYAKDLNLPAEAGKLFAVFDIDEMKPISGNQTGVSFDYDASEDQLTLSYRAELTDVIKLHDYKPYRVDSASGTIAMSRTISVAELLVFYAEHATTDKLFQLDAAKR